jgi:hypothetical protein
VRAPPIRYLALLGCLACLPDGEVERSPPGPDGEAGGPMIDTGRDSAGHDTAGDTAGSPELRPPLSEAPTWRGEGAAGYDWYGFSVASAGDVDGDGIADVIVGARNTHVDQPNEGSAYLYLGTPRGLTELPVWETRGGVRDARLGEAVAGVGDVDGEGFDDVVTAAANFPTPAGGNGRVYLHKGGPGGLRVEPVWSFDSEQRGSWLGRSVAGAGDVNGDGYADVLVGEKYHGRALRPAEGRVHLFLGGPRGLRAKPAWTYASGQAGAMLGFSVAGAGDVNGDGYDDVVVGAAFWDAAEPDAGIAWAFYGSPVGLLSSPDWASDVGAGGSLCGYPVSSAGDLDGDGFDDVAMGCMNHSSTAPAEGMVRVYRGSAAGLSDLSWELLGGVEGARLGHALSGGCDVDGNGFSDLVVTAPGGHRRRGRRGRGVALRRRCTGACCDAGVELAAGPCRLGAGKRIRLRGRRER